MIGPSPPADRLPTPVRAASRAAVSPSGLALAVAGTALGLVASLPLLAAAAIGAGCWGIRVAVASARSAGRRKRASRPEPIDPFAVPDPWRRFVREALTAQGKFDQAVARCQPGPLRDRLAEVSERVHAGARECWRVAHLGAALDATRAGLDPEATSKELGQWQRTHQRGASLPGSAGPASGAGRPGQPGSDDQTEAALAGRLQAGRRIEAAAQRATDRLRVLTAELNGAVASAVELSLDAGSLAAAGQLAGNVDTVVGEIEVLRQALEETVRPIGGTANS